MHYAAYCIQTYARMSTTSGPKLPELQNTALRTSSSPHTFHARHTNGWPHTQRKPRFLGCFFHCLFSLPAWYRDKDARCRQSGVLSAWCFSNCAHAPHEVRRCLMHVCGALKLPAHSGRCCLHTCREAEYVHKCFKFRSPAATTDTFQTSKAASPTLQPSQRLILAHT